MASKLFRPSRIIAVVLVIGAAAWLLSGAFQPREQQEGGDAAAAESDTQIPTQRVGVTLVTPEQHRRQVILSCVTEADHRAKAVARGGGVIIDLSISRGDQVKSGDVVAIISDEGRVAALQQAQALHDQRKAEYEANRRLIEQGNAPRNQLPALEAAVAAARAALSAAAAEAEKSSVKSPIEGIVDSVAVQVGQAVQPGTEIAAIVDPDPMLAVGQVSEARRGSLLPGQEATVRFIDSTTVQGTVNFVGLSAATATRTYPVEATMANADAKIADGVTCEMTVTLAPVEATAVPRSALVFSDEGHLGVRIADGQGTAQFVPVGIVDDGREFVWVTGLDRETQVIVIGQDFVKDGDPVEAVSATEADARAEPPA